MKHYFPKYFSIFILFYILSIAVPAHSQNFKQTISGYVYDSFTDTPIPGATIIIEKDSVTVAIATDLSGFFIFKNMPIGKYVLTASYIGYETNVVPNLSLTSGKSVNTIIQLSEATHTIETVTINAHKDKAEALNEMAVIGARSFTLDETTRYAGSYGDPARMAMNYAGVLPVRDNRNDIIIRGNSAFSLQWRLEDTEIPNPNHFGASATTGGPITIINTNLLSKSDFLSGTFPAEYGNAIAGVFDLKMRTGNLQKHEKWLQLGWNGLEIGLEGPLVKKHNYSYIFSYRHSINDIIYRLGIESKDIISYKDLTFKLNFPGTKTGNWSIAAMGGNSQIVVDELKYEPEERTFASYGEVLDNNNAMGVVILKNKLYPNSKSKIINTFSITGSAVNNKIDTFSVPQNDPFLWAVENTEEISYTAETKLLFKIQKGAKVSVGANYRQYVLSFNDQQYINGVYLNYTNTSNAVTGIIRTYIEFKKNFGEKLDIYTGLNGQYFLLNNSKAIEPRFGLKYTINNKTYISYGLGFHSQLQPLVIYFVQTEIQNSPPLFTNKELEFTKSIQNVLGYNLHINKNLRLKIDAYYQYIYDAPVDANQAQYSLLNFGTEYYVDRKDSLENTGTGENYGLELTFEQFFYNNFFYLITATLFESNYTSTDQITRSTAYNGNYSFNALGGYELNFPKKHMSLIFGINITFAGGSPYVPFDQEKTVEQGRIIYDWEQAYKVKRDDYKRVSLRLGIKRNFKRSSVETSFDLQYRTDYTDIYLEKINLYTGEIVESSELKFYPMVYTRFNF